MKVFQNLTGCPKLRQIWGNPEVWRPTAHTNVMSITIVKEGMLCRSDGLPGLQGQETRAILDKKSLEEHYIFTKLTYCLGEIDEMSVHTYRFSFS